MKGRGKPKKSGPLDGEGRRSIYVAIRRNFLSPFMLAFDTPTPFSTMGRRNVSNVPAQSLTLMNDPFVAEQSRVWAKRAIKNGDDAQERIQWMYLAAFSREPSEAELEFALEFALESDNGETDVDRWSAFAHALDPAYGGDVVGAATGAGKALHGPHHEVKAKNVIFLYMDGGPSQIDTFDPKPLLDKYNGKDPKDLFKVEPAQFNNGKVLASPWKVKQYGESGLPVSSLFPHVASCADD